MASVKFILRTDKTDNNGYCPIYIILIKDRKKKYVSTGIKAKESQWDDEQKKVRKNFPNSARTNALLLQKLADASGTVADMERKSKSVSARKLKEAVKGKGAQNYFAYAEDRCEKIKGTVSARTYKAYKSSLKKFEEFTKTKDVDFDDITVTMLKDYVNYCSNTLKNSNTTIKYSLVILAIFFKEAINEELVDANLYPFSKISIKRDPSKRSFLSKTQLEEFKKYEVNQESKAPIVKDMFLFSANAGGLRLSDVIELTWENVNFEENKIRKQIRKTGRTHSFKFGNSALAILNKYKPKEINPKHFVFPMLENGSPYFENDAYRLAEVGRCTSLCSLHLSAIGKKMKLPFPLSFHLARHTYATQALNNGMRIEHVSKLMDHTDIGTTLIYAKIISQELDEAVEKYMN